MEKKNSIKVKVLLLLVGILILMYFLPRENTAAGEDEAIYKENTAAYESDFFSDFRLKRAAWRDSEEEAIHALIENGSTEEAKNTAAADLMTLLRKIETEDMIEEVLKGRQYEEAIFVLDEDLSLLILKKKTFSEGEIEALVQFAAASAGVDSGQISFFTVE